MPHAFSLENLIRSENLLVLAPGPGDESLHCGGLIATSCARGRPPYVMVLSDGSATPANLANTPEQLAHRHERETRDAVKILGLPEGRLLMVGLFDGTIPTEGAVFEAVVRAVTLVMWARDCNVIVAPAQGPTAAIAEAVATRSGVGHLIYGTNETRLDIASQLDAKRAAMAAHTLLPPQPPPEESFSSPAWAP